MKLLLCAVASAAVTLVGVWLLQRYVLPIVGLRTLTFPQVAIAYAIFATTQFVVGLLTVAGKS
jgi:hypothetical protein